VNPRAVDYYVVLQVHPDAEHEIIEAAYRQLMRKYHPDVGGGDPAKATQLHERAKAINQAYAVLRDPMQRRIYDGMRRPAAASRTAPPPPPPPPPPPGPPVSTLESAWRSAGEREEEAQPTVQYVVRPWWWSALNAPMAAIASAYFLLPGPYEWEPASQREVVHALAIPPLGIASWLTITGRLDPWVGNSMVGVLSIWALLGVVALVAVGSALPRLALAGGATLLLLSGSLDASLRMASIPLWLAWGGLTLVSLLVAARAFIFGVLPTIGLCLLLTRFV